MINLSRSFCCMYCGRVPGCGHVTFNVFLCCVFWSMINLSRSLAILLHASGLGYGRVLLLSSVTFDVVNYLLWFLGVVPI